MVSQGLKDLIPIEELGDHFPTYRGRKISSATAWRWVLEGLIGPTGERVKLGSVKVGRRRFISQEAIDRFVEARNAGPVPPPSPTEVARRGAEASRALEALKC